MIFKDFLGEQVSMLGFGGMRFPLEEDGRIDEAKTGEMFDYAMAHGLNYFDTAYPYHNEQSEGVMGKLLSKYPRDSYFLADKYPGHQIADSFNPAETFEEQLRRCGVEYFDYYMLHNVYEKSIENYLDPRWKMIEYFKEQKRLGRIKHLGFSCHAALPFMRKFLKECGEDMDFCQIQLNYLDWTLQKGREKCELLAEYGLPIIVMEPVRGGKLAELSEEAAARLQVLRPGKSTASWAFRFLQDVPGVVTILSGMSNMEQVKDNLATFDDENYLSAEEKETLLDIAEGLKDSVPCTECRYCCKDCPKQLDIPALIELYNDVRISPKNGMNLGMRLQGYPLEKQASACIGCGKCTKMCPQNIDIPQVMADLAEKIKELPNWEKICRERAAAKSAKAANTANTANATKAANTANTANTTKAANTANTTNTANAAKKMRE